MRDIHCHKSSQYNAQIHLCYLQNANNYQEYENGLEKV